PHPEGVRGFTMPSTHLSLHYHIVFCTKERRRIIAELWLAELHAYIGGIIRDTGALARSVGVDPSTRRREVCLAGGLGSLYGESVAIEQGPAIYRESDGASP